MSWGAINTRQKKLKRPPVKLDTMEIPSARPASPFWVRGNPSIVVAEADGEPGMLMRMAAKLPPVIPPANTPSKSATAVVGSRMKVTGNRMMMPALVVRPGIIPHMRPCRAPKAVARMLVGASAR